jgi:hypothetical protein
MTCRTLMQRKWIFLLICLSMIAALVACASNSGGSGGSATTPTVSLVTPPPTKMSSGTKVSLAASITGDSTNEGVVWSCTPSNSCGAFSPNNTLTTTYTAPTVTATTNVTITVASVSDSSASVSAPIAINAPLLADGNYIFSLSGTDKTPTSISAHSPYYVVGVFTVANGAITAGEQDFSDFAFYPNETPINPVGSGLSQTADGNLQITLAITCKGEPQCTAGANSVETFNASFLPSNPNKAYIVEFDTSAAGSGTLQLQDTAAAATAPTEGYAFALNGVDKSAYPAAIGGVIDVNPVGTVSLANSIFDIIDDYTGAGNIVLLGKSFQQLQNSVSTLPDGFGRVEFQLSTVLPWLPQTSAPVAFNLVGYIVDSTRIQLIETSDGYNGTLGGAALSQGTNTGNISSIAGNYVFGLNGSYFFFDKVAPLQIATLLNFNSGSISGFLSTDGQPQSPFPIVAAPGINYTVDPRGRVLVTGLTAGSHAFSPGIYLDGNGHAMAITLDSGTEEAGDILEGVGFQQSGGGSFTAASFNGSYGIEATGWDENLKGEFDAAGTITATGSSGIFSGAADLNWLTSAAPSPGLSISGALTPAANGIFTGTITGLDVTTPSNNDEFNLYMIDPTGDAIAIETDSNQLTLIYFNYLDQE